MFIYSKVSAGLLFIEDEAKLDAITILDAKGIGKVSTAFH